MIKSYDDFMSILYTKNGRLPKVAPAITKVYSISSLSSLVRDIDSLRKIKKATDEGFQKLVDHPFDNPVHGFIAEFGNVQVYITLPKSSNSDGHINGYRAIIIESGSRINSIINNSFTDSTYARMVPMSAEFDYKSGESKIENIPFIIHWGWNSTNFIQESKLESLSKLRLTKINGKIFDNPKIANEFLCDEAVRPEFYFVEKLSGVESIDASKSHDWDFLMNTTWDPSEPFNDSPDLILNTLPESRDISAVIDIMKSRSLTDNDKKMAEQTVMNFLHFERMYYRYILILSAYMFLLSICDNVEDSKSKFGKNVSYSLHLPKKPCNSSKKKKKKHTTAKKIVIENSELRMKGDYSNSTANLIGNFDIIDGKFCFVKEGVSIPNK